MENLSDFKLEIFLRIKNLKIQKKETIITIKNNKSEEKECENISNQNIKWEHRFECEYSFGQIDIYEVRKYFIEDERRKAFGKLQFSLAEIIYSNGMKLTKPLLNENNEDLGESIEIIAREIQNINLSLTLNIFGRKLDPKGSYLIFKKPNQKEIFKTETQTQKSPKWKPVIISTNQLCDNNLSKLILVECYKFDSTFIGNFQFTMENLISQNQVTLPLKIANSQKKTKSEIVIQISEKNQEKSFLDFLQKTMFHLIIGIDFTISNGRANMESSLHHLDKSQPNQYQQIISQIGNVFEYLNKSKKKLQIPVFGFGAKFISQNGKEITPDFFPLNNNSDNPEIKGIDNVLSQYENSVETLYFYGPSNFIPIITSTKQITKHKFSSNDYYVLLIITDGDVIRISEFQKEIESLNNYSLSIVVFGIGDLEFPELEMIDQQDLNGFTFIPFSKIEKNTNFAKKVLRKIPKHCIQQFKQK
ncbi:copine-8 [Anaeramoeba ignava]|uniref:Copine-8 n=1 Tax=Anaeramoeba ignava TaxID=1746090 RepID=A0A9Q0R5D5_ANAIG|nr:copine-8 [Anaeramoeba ignava]